MTNSSYIGVASAIAGNLCISVGLNIQKHAHNALHASTSKTTNDSVEERDRLRRKCSSGAIDDENIQYTRCRSDYLSNEGIGDGDFTVVRSRSNSYSRSSDCTLQMDGACFKSGSSPSEEQSRIDYTKDDDEEAQVKVGSFWGSYKWWVGMILLLLGETGNFTAYGFAPAVLVAPLGTVTLISNALIAPLFLGEHLTPRNILGLLFAILGTTIILIVSSQISEADLGPDDITNAISRPTFVTYTAACLFSLGLLLWMRSRTRLHRGSRQKASRTLIVHLLVVGLLGGYTVMSTKCLSSLLKYSSLHLTESLSDRSFILLLLFLIGIIVATGIGQIHYLNESLGCFDSVQVIPIHFVFFNFFSILGCSILFGGLGETVVQPNVLLGITFMFLGVYLIHQKLPTSRPRDSGTSSRETGEWVHKEEVDNYTEQLLSPKTRIP